MVNIVKERIAAVHLSDRITAQQADAQDLSSFAVRAFRIRLCCSSSMHLGLDAGYQRHNSDCIRQGQDMRVAFDRHGPAMRQACSDMGGRCCYSAICCVAICRLPALTDTVHHLCKLASPSAR